MILTSIKTVAKGMIAYFILMTVVVIIGCSFLALVEVIL